LKVALKTKNQSINQLNRSGLWQLELRSVRGVQQYVIKFASDLRQVGDFLSAPPVTSTNKTDRHDITIKQTIIIESLSKNESLLYLDFYRGRRSQTSDILMPFVRCKRIA
jgi:hypothetical protein